MTLPGVVLSPQSTGHYMTTSAAPSKYNYKRALWRVDTGQEVKLEDMSRKRILVYASQAKSRATPPKA